VHGGLPVAIKVVDVAIDYFEALRSLREVKVLRFLSECPTSTQLLDGWMHGRQMYLVMPAYEFTLHEVLADASFVLEESHLRRIALLLLRSVAYLHAGGVLHRDIKPYNVLMRTDCTLALCDFNLARPARRTASGERMTPLTPFAALPHMSNSVVTRWYRAPEVLLGEPYSYSVDMWAVAATLAEVAMRRPLWPSRSDTHQLQMYVRTLGPPTEADMLEWEAPTRSVMSVLAPCAEVIALPTAFPGLHDLLRRILVWRPSARLTAAEALAHPWLSGAVSPVPLPRAPMEDEYEAALAAHGRPSEVFRALRSELASL
jgi:serine/threonine protein kinase